MKPALNSPKRLKKKSNISSKKKNCEARAAGRHPEILNKGNENVAFFLSPPPSLNKLHEEGKYFGSLWGGKFFLAEAQHA